MKIAVFSSFLIFALNSGVAVGNALGYRALKCDEACAKSRIQNRARPSSYCASYLYPYGPPTKRVTVTASVTATVTGCTTPTITRTSTSTDLFSNAKRTVTLPVITVTLYTSSVIIPSGPTPVINKRNPQTAAAAVAGTCPALGDCPPRSISAACSSIYKPPTTTITVTPKPPKACKKTVTETITVNFFTEITKGVATVTPGPDFVFATRVLTTTVPAICVQDPYTPPDDIMGDFVKIVEYPNFPRTSLECCALCQKTKNCAASAFSDDLSECQLLLVQNNTGGSKSNICPFGVQDLNFLKDFDFGVNTFPGPCGK